MTVIVTIVMLLIIGCAPAASLSNASPPPAPTEIMEINKRLTRLEQDVLMLKDRWQMTIEQERRERRRER